MSPRDVCYQLYKNAPDDDDDDDDDGDDDDDDVIRMLFKVLHIQYSCSFWNHSDYKPEGLDVNMRMKRIRAKLHIHLYQIQDTSKKYKYMLV